jgi:hypothetical protein
MDLEKCLRKSCLVSFLFRELVGALVLVQGVLSLNDAYPSDDRDVIGRRYKYKLRNTATPHHEALSRSALYSTSINHNLWPRATI